MRIRLFGRTEITRVELERIIHDRIYLKEMTFGRFVDEVAAILELAGVKIKGRPNGNKIVP